jgi:DNA polymerase-3 subunit delta'
MLIGQKLAEARLARAIASEKVGHAYLFLGPTGSGKSTAARLFAQALNCEQQPAVSSQQSGDGGTLRLTPCGECQSCRRIAVGKHPEVLEVWPDSKTGQNITVDLAREIRRTAALRPKLGRRRIYLVPNAETFNEESANALLKTLEEPRAGAMLILVTARPSLLPATVRSRCLRLSLRAPDREQALAWLRARDAKLPWEAALDVLGNAPYAALSSDPGALAAVRADTMQAVQDLRQGRLDVVRTAERWGRGEDFPHRLACLETWLTGLVLRACDTTGEKREMRPGAHLSGPEADINIAGALGLLDHLTEMRQQAATPLNKGLVLERFLWRLGRVATRQQSRGV